MPDVSLLKSDELWEKQYYAMCGDLSSKAMEAKARRGEFPGCAPIGYKNAYVEDGAKTIVIDDVFGPLVKETFELAATGKYSLRKLLKIVTDKGLISRNGKQLGPTALRNLLMNPFYIGQIRYQGELLQGNHQSLVSYELFGQVQKHLRNRAR